MLTQTSNQASAPEKQITYLKYLRALATITVVSLHILYTGVGLNRGTLTSDQNLWTMFFVNASMYAVPLFVMVTGALLLSPMREITYQKIFRKYALRILSALAAFSFIYRIFDIIMDGEDFSLSNLCYALYEMVTASGWSHLWYIYLLLGLYIMLPFYRMIAGQLSRKDAIYLITVFLLYLSVFPLAEKYIHIGFYIHVATIYPFYLFTGYLIDQGILHLPAKSALSLFLGGLVISLAATYLTYRHDMETFTYFSGYSSISTIMQSVGLFSLLHDLAPSEHPFVNVIDRNSFGIYLIHMIFVRLLLRYMSINPYAVGNLQAVLIYVSLIIGITCISCLIGEVFKRLMPTCSTLKYQSKERIE